MTLRLYNSLGRRIEDFEPATDNVVKLYSCGPTVYSFAHIGNLRAYTFADTLRRALLWKGWQVEHVINITDVGHAVAEAELGDDKIELAAARERRSVEEIAEMYTEAFFADLDALNILPAHHYPRATQYVDAMIAFAERLVEHGFAYEIPSGLYFDTSKDPGYGRLGLVDVGGQLEGARVEQVPGRRAKTDFALWRAEAPGQIRAMRWNSPWGWGAPGWHLECSVMSMKLLGEHFDIHTGGVDHRQLHHVNEIAQSEAYLGDGRPWVRFWLHGEFLQLGAAKMAKSAGPVLTLQELQTQGFHPLAYRMFLLGGHYRAQLEFTMDGLAAAQATLRRLIRRTAALGRLPSVGTLEEARALASDDSAAVAVIDQLDQAISADLNTPRVLAVLQESLRDAVLSEHGQRVVTAASGAVLGLPFDRLEPADVEPAAEQFSQSDQATVDKLIAEREAARTARDWARADALRAELSELGVQLTDTPTGPVWSRTTS
ncbi:cysteine--tRNA ligase [Kribbella sp. NBC_01510]|uniref:cysteine--tRNA ligase n=1 Tax=Kribbella sp. NBC_01510 TaxID=2903581 RepID=UPI00386DC20B